MQAGGVMSPVFYAHGHSDEICQQKLTVSNKHQTNIYWQNYYFFVNIYNISSKFAEDVLKWI